MNPNSCSLGSLFAGSFSKTTIDLLKDPPIRIVNIKMCWKSMQYGPETFLGCDVIKA